MDAIGIIKNAKPIYFIFSIIIVFYCSFARLHSNDAGHALKTSPCACESACVKESSHAVLAIKRSCDPTPPFRSSPLLPSSGMSIFSVPFSYVVIFPVTSTYDVTPSHLT